jgi:sugar phosphate isomerase/epimerase
MRGMEIGVMNSIGKEPGRNIFAEVAEFGLKVCQLVNWDANLWTEEIARRVVRDSKDSGVRVCALWTGQPGPAQWNMVEGHTTLGLVPPEYREMRVAALKKGADFAKWIGVPAIITHCGFVPEEPTHPFHDGTLAAIREVAAYCKQKGLGFWFESGQETPVTLLRTIEDVGTGNLGVNLDPANLILYGKGNPIDALDVIGKYVRNLHAKDGLYPTTGRELGREVPVGKGKVRFPEFLKKLYKLGFRGELIIEREISGPRQAKDIRKTVNDLKRWRGRLK